MKNTEHQPTDVSDPEDLDALAARLHATADLLKEQRRLIEIRRGIDPDRPDMTAEQMQAAAVALRAQGDQELAKMRGAWRTYD